MISKNEKVILETSIRMALQQQLKDCKTNNPQVKKFIADKATYEQLLNATFNQHFGHKELPTDLLEAFALHSICKVLQPLTEGGNLTIHGILKNAYLALRKSATKYPGVATGAKWVSLGISAGVAFAYVYNKYLSIYVKTCKGLPKEKIPECIKKVKIQSLQKAAQALKVAQTSCSHLEDPEEIEICQREYAYEMEEIQNRISKLTSGKK